MCSRLGALGGNQVAQDTKWGGGGGRGLDTDSLRVWGAGGFLDVLFEKSVGSGSPKGVGDVPDRKGG